MPRPRKVATTPTFPCSLAAALSRQAPSQGEPRLGRRVTCPWPWIVRPTPPPRPHSTPIRRPRPRLDLPPSISCSCPSKPAGLKHNFLADSSGAGSPKWVGQAASLLEAPGKPLPCRFKLAGSPTFLGWRPHLILLSASMVVSPYASDSPASSNEGPCVYIGPRWVIQENLGVIQAEPPDSNLQRAQKSDGFFTVHLATTSQLPSQITCPLG